MIRSAIAVAIVVSACGGCAAVQTASSETILERNFAEISVREPKVCQRIKLYRTADGSLWIGDPAKAR